jgi:hypothetical protein
MYSSGLLEACLKPNRIPSYCNKETPLLPRLGAEPLITSCLDSSLLNWSKVHGQELFRRYLPKKVFHKGLKSRWK